MKSFLQATAWLLNITNEEEKQTNLSMLNNIQYITRRPLIKKFKKII